ncbi:MAG: CPBP family intramembrane metalloprotease [Butyrivibrio sp.]|nr:CPBP family intramembrane metalloprotease [Butyrivibrio sp.]
MNNKYKILKTLFFKELKDVLRDKKALMMMILVPVVVYPLILLGAIMIVSMISENKDTVYDIAVYNESANFDAGNLENVLKENAIEKDEEDGSEEQLYTVNYEVVDGKIGEEDCRNRIDDKNLDVYIEITDAGDKANVKAFYMESVNESSEAMDKVRRAVDSISDSIVEKNVESAGLNANDLLNPIAFEKSGLSSDEQMAGLFLGTMLPMMIMLSILISVMHPSIDLTAGEKERGTLETLLMLPVPGKYIVIAKIFTASLCGVVTAILNILAMSTVFGVILENRKASGLFEGMNIELSSFISAMLVTFPVIIVTSLFMSAIFMCFTCFAKSYKEANSYVSPIMMVLMFLGYGSMIPTLELNQYVAIVPVLNVSVLLRDALNFKLNYSMLFLTLCSMVLYSTLAVIFFSKAYNSENLLFGDGKNEISLFEKRSNHKKGMPVTIGDVCFLYPFVILVYLLFGSLLQLKYELAGLFLSQFLILVGIPLAFFIYSKKDIKKAYSFNKCSPLSFVGGVLVGCGALLFAMLLGTVILKTTGITVNQGLVETFEKFFSHNVIVATLCIAGTPAIAEEMLFRGVVFSAIKDKMKPVYSVLIVSVLFGLFHMNLLKFFTTGAIGALLCLIVYYGGSIYPAMLAHFMVNFLSTVISKYGTEQVTKILSNPVMGIIGFGVAIAGLLIVKYSSKKATI